MLGFRPELLLQEEEVTVTLECCTLLFWNFGAFQTSTSSEEEEEEDQGTLSALDDNLESWVGSLEEEAEEAVEGILGERRKNFSLPSKWDWREHGAVTPVKNQGGRPH